MASMRQGQTIEWDETVTDTVKPPASLNDSSSEFRNLAIRRQIAKYHVIVSIPDSTVQHFRIERKVTQYAQRDTMGGQRISKVVTYGSQQTSYDQDNVSIGTTTLAGGDSTEDFAELPFFEYRPDTVQTDSQRTKFVDTMTSLGATVTNLGSDGYKVEMNFVDGSTTWTSAAYFDHDYLTMTHMSSTGGGTVTDVYYSYTSVGGYKINTQRITTATTTPPSDWRSLYSTNAPQVNSDSFTAPTVTTLVLSNISLP